ncbi:Pantothenate kinase [Roseibaca ekhonensis]|jgi:pantothenate kinase|uniref:Pantothenate kinase n=1 Tax=Roseinatronobacter ekhonensis TaxID=254356 RepID=A0A3B0MVX7_9RHOB|nr:uridine kinase [Roseibaca ekhonensis]SUZ32884.1 Pantothenate kinase [Roseibaca ekhonensis]
MLGMEQDITTVLNLIARTQPQPGCRKVIGIVGPPGSGKSTLAAAFVDRLNRTGHASAMLVPMDGFHMDNDSLDRAGLRAVKGAPETFEVAAFVATLRALRPEGATGTFPVFDRTRDCTVPDAQQVTPEVDTLVVEGNYLLLEQAPWDDVGRMLDASVALTPSLAVLQERLVARWLSYGLSPEIAEQKAGQNDLPNARRVLQESSQATLTLTQGTTDIDSQ